jgi:hypothetical protein
VGEDARFIINVDGVTCNGQTVSNTTTPIYESPFLPPNSTEGNVYGSATFAVNYTTDTNTSGSSVVWTSQQPTHVSGWFHHHG